MEVANKITGRWRVNKFNLNKESTITDNQIFRFSEDGTVDYAYRFNNQWAKHLKAYTLIEKEGTLYLEAEDRIHYSVIELSDNELTLGVFDRYKAPRLIYCLSRY